MQDGAPSHTAKHHPRTSEGEFWSEFYPQGSMTSMTSNSPECNPLENFFWDAVKQKVYEG